MSGMGIYGLSGSGIDVDSMVRMGMLSKQNQYDKMYKEEVKNEWVKEAYTNMYSSLNTFNSSTLYNYKLSSTTSPMSAASSNTTVATAVANADASIMSHTVNVTSTAANAYLLTKDKISRANGDESIYLKDVLFDADKQAELKKKMNDEDLEDEALISFTIADGTGDKANSKQITFTYADILSSNQTLNDLASKMNSAGVNIKASYDSVNDAFSLYQKSGGEANKIVLTAGTDTASEYGKDLITRLDLRSVTQSLDSSGNLTSELSDPLSFETTTGNSTITAASFTSGTSVTADKVLNTLFTTSTEGNGATFTITKGGTDSEINISDVTTATVQDLVDAINNASSEKSLGITASIKDGKLKIANTEADDTNTISFTVSSSDTSANAVNGRKMLNALQLSSDKLTTDSNGIVASGQDAKVTIDGREYSSDSSKITVANVTYSLAAKGSTVVTVNQDTDKLVENVKKFVEDYNKMLDELNDKYYEERYSDYGVLTQTQEKGMTKEQIDKWNEKAKSGLLNHNSTIGKVISEMREALYTPVDGVTGKYNTMMSLGITSATDRGHLTLDEDKLKKALAAEPDCVRQIFNSDGDYKDKNGETQTDYGKQGVIGRISDSLYKNLKTMKSYAGTTTEVADGSSLGDLIRELQTKMSNFKTMMNAFENQLYKKYDAMEVAIQRMSVSMGYITGGQ